MNLQSILARKQQERLALTDYSDLDFCLLLALTSPEALASQSFIGLKAALRFYCVTDAFYSKTYPSAQPYPPALPSLTYPQFRFIEELSYQASRFLRFGCMYAGLGQWDQPSAPDQAFILNRVFFLIENFSIAKFPFRA